MTPEPFVSAEKAAEFLSIKRRHLLALARKGIRGAYALGHQRRTWVFRLSELAEAVANDRTPESTELRYDASQPSVLVNERR